MTPNEIAQSYIDVTKSLIDVLAEENAALSDSSIERIVELQEAKQTAADLYEARVREITRQPDILEQTAPAVRQELDRVNQAFETATSHNANALRAAMEMNRRLVGTIAQSVEQQRITAAGYTKSGGAYAQQAKGAHSDTVPVTLDETF